MRIAIILVATLLGATSDAPPPAMGDFEEAIVQAARADRAGTGEQQMDRARALAMLGRNEEALAVADAAVATNPYDFGLPVGRGEVLDLIGRRTETLASYRVGLARFESWLETATDEEADIYLRFHVLLLVRLDRLADALRIIDARPERSASARLLALGCEARAEANAEMEHALADCNAALRAEPRNDRALFARGLVFLRTARWADAEREFGALLANQPQNPDALYGRGLARQHQRQTSAANADIAASRRQLFYIDSEFNRRGLRQLPPSEPLPLDNDHAR